MRIPQKRQAERKPADGIPRRPRPRPARGIFLVLSLLAAIGAFNVASAGPAAAVSCFGDWCSGQNPQSTGCANDAYTFANARIPGTYTNIELRWSPTCKTEWARVASSWGQSYPNNLRAVQRDTGYSQIGIVASNADYAWTRMIYSPVKCVYAAWVGPPGTTSTSCV